MVGYFYPHPHSADGLESAIRLEGARLTIGRSAANEVEIALPNISRHHATLHMDDSGEGWLLNDNGSSNGTFVNGERLAQPRLLKEGDVIGFGTIECIFSMLPPEDRNTIPSFVTLSSQSSSNLNLVRDGEEASTPGMQFEAAVTSESADGDGGEPVTAAANSAMANALKLTQKRLQIMYDLSVLASRSTSVEQMTGRALDMMFNAVEIDRAAILMCDRPNMPPTVLLVRTRDPDMPQIQVSISNSIVQRCITERIALLSHNVAHDTVDGIGKRYAVICVPLIAHLDVIGVLFMDAPEDHRTYTEEDLAFVSAFGTDLALAISNFRMNQLGIRAARMAAMGTAIAGLAHNVKNILQLIDAGMTLMDTAIAKRPPEDEVSMYWPVVRRGVGRMQELSHELLTFSRQAPPELKYVSVNKVICTLAEDIIATMNASRVELRLELADDLPPHKIDPEGTSRAFANLMSNAMDAMGRGGGLVTVRTMSTDNNNALRITIADTGVGIPAEKLARIWEPFFTTKGQRGTGLGLAMTRKCVEDMNGHIGVTSTEGVGTTFEITLPARRPPQTADGEAMPMEDYADQTIIVARKSEGLFRKTAANNTTPASGIVLPPELR